MSVRSRLQALERELSGFTPPPIRCKACGHPRRDATGLALTFDGEFPFLCRECREPVGPTGKALAKLCPNGEVRLAVMGFVSPTEDERAVLIRDWI
jgi:hypothetical protein